jgi:hypothetical protein
MEYFVDKKKFKNFFVKYKKYVAIQNLNKQFNQENSQQIIIQINLEEQLKELLEKMKSKGNRLIILQELIKNKAGKGLIKALFENYKIENDEKEFLFWDAITEPKIKINTMNYLIKGMKICPKDVIEEEINQKTPDPNKIKNILKIFQVDWGYFPRIIENQKIDYKIFKLIFKKSQLPLRLDSLSDNPIAWEVLMDIGIDFTNDPFLFENCVQNNKRKFIIMLLLSNQYTGNQLEFKVK